MPSVAEIQWYLRGLWLLFKNDPANVRYLDFSERGFRRSFWAMAFGLPCGILSIIFSARLQEVAFSINLLFAIRALLVNAIAWIVPLLIFGATCVIIRRRDVFLKVVVATNWLSLATSALFTVMMAIIAAGPQLLAFIIEILLRVTLLAAFLFEARILYILFGERVIPTAASIILSAIATMLISVLGTSYMLAG